MLERDLSNQIIRSFYKVYNTLGYGFLEKVYENALYLELINNGIYVKKQCPVQVYYDGTIVGNYYADIIVEDKIILELKSASTMAPEHEYQLINYLKATEIEVGILLNFGKEPQFSRKIFTNDRKGVKRNTDDTD
ncbi:MAG: GxxExxY protein [Bacteroidales bacterium]|nr:GxxExxY protein [Bacteroidales bacterium]